MVSAGLLLLLVSCTAGALRDRRAESASARTEATPYLRLLDDKVAVEKRSSGGPEFPFIVTSEETRSSASVPKYSDIFSQNLHLSRTEMQSNSKFQADSSPNKPTESEWRFENDYINFSGNNFSVITTKAEENSLKLKANPIQIPHELIDQNLGMVFDREIFLPMSLLKIPKAVLQYLISIKRDDQISANTSYFEKNKIPVYKSSESNSRKNSTGFLLLSTVKPLTKTTESKADFSSPFRYIPSVDSDVHNFIRNSSVKGNDTNLNNMNQVTLSSLPRSPFPSMVNSTRKLISASSPANVSSVTRSQALQSFSGEKPPKTTVSFQVFDQQQFRFSLEREANVEETTETKYDGKIHDYYNVEDFEAFPNNPLDNGFEFETASVVPSTVESSTMRNSLGAQTEKFSSSPLNFNNMTNVDVKKVDNSVARVNHGSKFYNQVTDSLLHHSSTLEEDLIEDTNSSNVMDMKLESLLVPSSVAETNRERKSGTSMPAIGRSERTFSSEVGNKSTPGASDIWGPYGRRTFKTSLGTTQPPAERTTRRQRRTMYVVVVEERPCEGACCKRERYTGRCRLVLGCALLRFHFLAVRKLSCGTTFHATPEGGPSLEPPPVRPRASPEDRTPSGERVTLALGDDASTGFLVNRSIEVPRTDYLTSTNLFGIRRFDIPRNVHLSATNSSVNLNTISRAVETSSTSYDFETATRGSLPVNKTSFYQGFGSTSSFNISVNSSTGVRDSHQFSTSSPVSKPVNLSSVDDFRINAVNESKLTHLNASSIHVNEISTVVGSKNLTSSNSDSTFEAATSVKESHLERKITQTEIGIQAPNDTLVPETFEDKLNKSCNLTAIRGLEVTFFTACASQYANNSTQSMHLSSNRDGLDVIHDTVLENTTTEIFSSSEEHQYATNDSDPLDFVAPTAIHAAETDFSDKVKPTTEVPQTQGSSSMVNNSYSENKTYAISETSAGENEENEAPSATHIPPDFSTRDLNASTILNKGKKLPQTENGTSHAVDVWDAVDVTGSEGTSAPPALTEEEKQNANEEEAGEWDAYITDELSIDYNYEEYTTDPEYDYYYYDEPEEPATQHVTYTDQVWMSQAGAPGPVELSEVESVALGRSRGRAEEPDAEWINEDNRRHPHLVLSSHAQVRG